MRKLVLTLAVGDAHKRMGEVTHPTHKAYAKRIGAEFAVISEVKNGWRPHWGKCAIYDLLGGEWDRIIYIDTDAIVRPDCPDLFEVVPEENFGAFNEGKFLPRQEIIAEGVRQYCDKPLGWDGLYFNSGVMVISRRHRQMFRPPVREPQPILWEQTYLNITRIVQSVPVQDIKPEYNYMPSLQSLTGYPMGYGFIAHFAGTPAPLAEQMAREQIAEWEGNPAYSYCRRIWFDFGGGLGDVIDAEPVLRYARSDIFPGDDIRVTTPWPRVFQPCDLPLSYAAVSPFGDDSCVKLQTVPDRLGEGVLQVLTHVSSNATDFASIGLLHQQLPLDRKRAQLHVTEEDVAEVDALAGEFDLSQAVLIHPGRTWDSRTFPVEWWQEIINGIAAECPVALMGLNGEIHGVLPVECPENGLDLRDRTSMGAMFELVRRCPVLVTNDSSPVHVAGAFDNWIVLIPSARQPDFVLPVRQNKTPYWRADALYKRLTIDDVERSPLDYYGTHANGFEGDWKDYLPDAKDVIAAALRGRSEVLNGNEKLCVAGGDAALGGGEAGVEPGNGHKRNGRGGSGRRAKAPALPGKA
jgi:hypothetical protein